MEDKKEVQIAYRITKIQTLKFSFEDIEEKVLNQFMSTDGNLGVNFNVGIEFTSEHKTVKVDIYSRLFVKESDLTLISHVGRTIFDVEGLENAFDKEKGSYDLPNVFLIQILSISYTHARALLNVEINPTVFRDKYFLPVIDPTKLLPNQDVSLTNT